MNVSELLDRFARDRSEEAFSELMRGHVNLVYSVARRRLHDSTQVEEVVQDVFIRLARSDKFPTSEAELVGWLHASAHRVSIDRWRKDSRRQNREMKASEMIPAEVQPEPTWNDLAPVLDEAIAELNPVERNAILLRYFNDHPFHAVAQALCVTDAAAKMRVSRSLDKLRDHLLRKGIACSTLSLMALLDNHAVAAAPAATADRAILAVRNSLFVPGHALRKKAPVVTGFKTFVTCLILGTALLIGLSRYLSSQSRRRDEVRRNLARRPANTKERSFGVRTFAGQNPPLAGVTSIEDLLARLRLILDQAYRVRVYPPNTLLQTLLECTDSPNDTLAVLVEYLGNSDYETRHWAAEGLQVLVQDSRFQSVQSAARLALMRVAVSPDESEVLRQFAFMAAVSPDWSRGIGENPTPPASISDELLQMFAQSFNQSGADMVSSTGGRAVILSTFLSQTKQNVDGYCQALESTLVSGDSNQRLVAAIALAGLPGDKAPQVKSELVRALREDSPLLPTAQAALALGQLGSAAEDALPDLTDYVDRHQNDKNNRKIAEQVIADIDGARSELAPDPDPGWVEMVTDAQPSAQKQTQLTEYFERLREELNDPEKRRTFVPEARWINVSAYWMVEQMKQAQEAVASQSDPEIAGLIRQIPVGLHSVEDAPVDLETEGPGPAELIGRAFGVAEHPDNGISSETLVRLKEWAARDGSFFGRASDFLSGSTRSDKLVEIARAIGAIDPKLYQAAMKSFLDDHPEMDRLLIGTKPVVGFGLK
jgi:RNA polymerase sigma factor (sigma-70 family)